MNNRKRTATITFHAAHNYGSMLQAYALQQTLIDLGVDNDIINLRTDRQKTFYPNPYKLKNVGWYRKLKFFILGLLIPGYKESLLKKYLLFEDFLESKLILTREFSSSEEIRENLHAYDYYITGSDQCWNVNCGDFDWAYYLDFTDSLNKISYATSFGSKSPRKNIPKVEELLSKFRLVSVREIGSADYIKSVAGISAEIMPDPTLLIPSTHWSRLVGENPLIDFEYIFVYTPFGRVGTLEVASRLSELTGLPIVISNEPASRDMTKLLTQSNIKFKMDVGPIEFLNLIKNARYVVSGSFHAVVFSLIFHTRFVAVDGMHDNRMKELLSKYKCEDKSVVIGENGRFVYDSPPEAISPDIDNIIAAERLRALEYLGKALGI